MKKLLIIVLLSTVYLAACNSTPNKTGGETRDSSTSHTNSGPDTANGAGVMEAESTNGTDTSTDGQVTDAPLADTITAKKHKPHH